MIDINDIRNTLNASPSLSLREKWSIRGIKKQCIGYSGSKGYRYFRTLLARYPVKSVLVLGVYYGRDIAYMCDIARRLGRTDFHVTGVDKFSDDACEDWPEEKRELNWQQAGYGTAPELSKAQGNMKALGHNNVELIRMDDASYLASASKQFDFIYIDTSHEETTVRRQIAAAVRISSPMGLIGGDDYSDDATWGVISAVKGMCRDHIVFGDWYWTTSAAMITTGTSVAA